MQHARDRNIKVLDLYSGLGGLSLGFEMTGAFEVIGGIDNFDWAVKTFYHHHKLDLRLIATPQDMSCLDTNAVLDDLGTMPDVIVGGPPCQGFSHAGKRLEDMGDDTRNHQIFNFFRFVKDIKPKVFLMENVSGILNVGQSKKNELIGNLVAEYEKIGYSVSWSILNTMNYRVPQSRKRFIMVGVLDRKQKFTFPTPPCSTDDSFLSESTYTVLDALGDIPSPTDENPQPYSIPASTDLQRFLRQNSSGLFNHLNTRHSDDMIQRLEAQKIGTRLYPNWNHSWYRLDPSRPSPAVKENHRAPFVHFSEPRATSPRECARLQTIPDRYELLGTKTAQLIMIGNAVPPVFAAHLATAIAEQFFNIRPASPWDLASNPMQANRSLVAGVVG